MLENLTRKFDHVLQRLSGKDRISEKNIHEAVEEIKLSLLDADVNLRVARRFINQTIEESRGRRVLQAVNPGQMFTKILFDKLTHFLGDEKSDLRLKGSDATSIILLMGVQGSGKTTTAAKLAKRLIENKRKPLLVAADLARPAAIEQLKILGQSIDVPVYSQSGADPIAAAKNGVAWGRRQSFDTIIVDTAGRAQVDQGLMEQLEKLCRAIKPDETLLVADAMTGQQAVEIAKEFSAKIDLSGVILSKFDSDARGGAALSLKTVTQKAIKFIGVGETVSDLEVFHPDRIASRILGMGDVVTLVEKAREVATEKEVKEMEAKMASRSFTLVDYLEQFQKVKKMGDTQSLLKMLPAGLAGQIGEAQLNETEMKSEEAIILSMTLKERRNHKIIGPSRKRRIAKGSGASVHGVNRLLKKFEKTRLAMKKFARNKGYQEKIMSRFSGAN